MLLLVSCCIFCIELQIQKYKKCGAAAVRPFLNLILLPVGVRVKFEFMNIFNAVLCFLSLNKQIISRILINAGFIFGKLALAKRRNNQCEKIRQDHGLDCIYCKYCTLYSYFCYFILGTYCIQNWNFVAKPYTSRLFISRESCMRLGTDFQDLVGQNRIKSKLCLGLAHFLVFYV